MVIENVIGVEDVGLGIHFVCEVCWGFEWHLKWMERFVAPHFSLRDVILNAIIVVMVVLVIYPCWDVCYKDFLKFSFKNLERGGGDMGV